MPNVLFDPKNRQVRKPLMGFVAMGVFWGAWSALIPAVQQAVVADDAALGRALLFVSVGAVPAMIFGGRLVDRFGPRLLGPSIAVFGLAALLPALAGSPLLLSAALLLVGAASGFMDVVMNARVSALESLSGRHFMNACHGTFSLTFFIAAIATGAARGAGASVLAALGTVAVLMLVLAALGWGRGPRASAVLKPAAEPKSGAMALSLPVAALGAVVFCAFLSENGLQQWSALHFERTLGAGPELAALGPAVLGLAFAVGRFGGQGLQQRYGLGWLVGIGAVLATIAVAVFAVAGNAPLALLAIVAAGLGISVIGPSALGSVARFVPPGARGRAVAAVSTIAYTGFFVGPALLGFVSSQTDLRVAIGVIAGFCLVLVPIWLWLLGRKGPAVAPVAS